MMTDIREAAQAHPVATDAFAQVLVASRRGKRGFYRVVFARTRSVWGAIESAMRVSRQVDDSLDCRYPFSVTFSTAEHVALNELQSLGYAWYHPDTDSWNAGAEGMPFAYPTGIVGDGQYDGEIDDDLQNCFSVLESEHHSVRVIADGFSLINLWLGLLKTLDDDEVVFRVVVSSGQTRHSFRRDWSAHAATAFLEQHSAHTIESGFSRTEIFSPRRDVIIRLFEDKDLIITTRRSPEADRFITLLQDLRFERRERIVDVHKDLPHWHYENEGAPAILLVPTLISGGFIEERPRNPVSVP